MTKTEFIQDILHTIWCQLADSELECWKSLKYQITSDLENDFSEMGIDDSFPPEKELAEAIIENYGLKTKESENRIENKIKIVSIGF